MAREAAAVPIDRYSPWIRLKEEACMLQQLDGPKVWPIHRGGKGWGGGRLAGAN